MNNIITFITWKNNEPKRHTKKYDRCTTHNITSLPCNYPGKVYKLVYSSRTHNFFKRVAA
jgi:hypothetical protein